MCPLRQSKHLQKKVKEKRDNCRMSRQRKKKLHPYPSNDSPCQVLLRKGQSFEVHTQDPNTYQINMYLYSDEVRDYMCTDGTLWFSTWALITWTLVMIFF